MQPTTTSYASFNSDLPSYVYSCATLPCSHASKHFITTSTSSMESTGLQHQASHTAEGGSTVATLARFSYISWYHKLKISKQSMIYISIRKSNNYRPGARSASHMNDRSFDDWLTAGVYNLFAIAGRITRISRKYGRL